MADNGACPLTTDEIVDLVLELVSMYNGFKKIHLYSYQRLLMRRITESVLLHDGASITALFARQTGKSEALASLVPGLCLVLPALGKRYPLDRRVGQYGRGFWIAIFAPVKEKAALIFDRVRERAEMREIKETFYASPGFGLRASDPSVSRGDMVAWSNGSKCVIRTASENVNSEGDTYDLVIIDEAQIVSTNKVNKEISPMLTKNMGTMVSIGTAYMSRNYFYHTLVANDNAVKAGGKVRNHFEFNWEKCSAAMREIAEETGDESHLNYEKMVRIQLKNQFHDNEDAPAFRLNFRLLWETTSMGAIDRDALVACADPSRELNEPRHYHRQVASIDYGKKRDMTILTIGEVSPYPSMETTSILGPGDTPAERYAVTIIAWYEIPGRKWKDILNTAVEIMDTNHVVDTIVCDATGVGDPLTEWLTDKAPYLNVIPFQMSVKGNDTAFKELILRVEHGLLRYCAGPETVKTPEYQEFFRQMEILERHRVGETALIKCCAPEGDHDDYVDSAALLCIAACQESDTAENVTNPVYEQEQQAGSRESRYRQGRAA